MTTAQPHPGVAERWTQARIRNLLASTYGRPQIARRNRLRAAESGTHCPGAVSPAGVSSRSGHQYGYEPGTAASSPVAAISARASSSISTISKTWSLSADFLTREPTSNTRRQYETRPNGLPNRAAPTSRRRRCTSVPRDRRVRRGGRRCRRTTRCGHPPRSAHPRGTVSACARDDCEYFGPRLDLQCRPVAYYSPADLEKIPQSPNPRNRKRARSSQLDADDPPAGPATGFACDCAREGRRPAARTTRVDRSGRRGRS